MRWWFCYWFDRKVGGLASTLSVSYTHETVPFTSAPPLAASFALGGPRWYRLLALPGMWLGMTIFISAWYGVSAPSVAYLFPSQLLVQSFLRITDYHNHFLAPAMIGVHDDIYIRRSAPAAVFRACATCVPECEREGQGDIVCYDIYATHEAAAAAAIHHSARYTV